MRIPTLLISLVVAATTASALDQNSNQQSDVWEMVFGVSGLPPAADADGDGFSNAVESAAGTNPLHAASFPRLELASDGSNSLLLAWMGLAGKKYALQSSTDLTPASWGPAAPEITGTGSLAQYQATPGAAPRLFFRLNISDQDTDGDGINDWEEGAIGFDPTRTRTDRNAQTDGVRVPAGLAAANTITVSVYDDTCTERWPDPGLLVVRRSGGLQPLTVNISLGGWDPLESTCRHASLSIL